MIEQITGFVDDLEAIWPAEAPRRERLVQIEIEEVNDEEALETVQDAAAGLDSVLGEAAGRKAAVIAERNLTGQVGTQDQARVRIGNEFANNFSGSGLAGFADQTSNSADTVDARGVSRVHIGTSYGGRGIFDD
ncbi:hypothetical protein PG993_008831 [Apiospora rasikravindrae]|uniref:Uncharacterized protein n=1 Tax=Apiospora rasikravindrae TaxID=990691 RepID=A0ABR1SPU9_9PEZI